MPKNIAQLTYLCQGDNPEALPAPVATLSQHLFYELPQRPLWGRPAGIHEWISRDRQSGRGHLDPKRRQLEASSTSTGRLLRANSSLHEVLGASQIDASAIAIRESEFCAGQEFGGVETKLEEGVERMETSPVQA